MYKCPSEHKLPLFMPNWAGGDTDKAVSGWFPIGVSNGISVAFVLLCRLVVCCACSALG